MISPSVRAAMGREEAQQIVRLIAQGDEDLRDAALRRLDEEGLDALLDDPRTLNALLTSGDVSVRPDVIFYVLVRQALLEGGINSRDVADYTAALVLRFGRDGRAYRPADGSVERYRYLVDLVRQLQSARGRRALLLSAHLGNYALWMAGLFPQHIAHRTQRRGAPGLAYYDDMGATGFRMASTMDGAEGLGLDAIFRDVADHFQGVRVALNRVSDRHIWRGAGDPVDRLLREVQQRAICAG